MCDKMTEEEKIEKRKTKKSAKIGTKNFRTLFTTTLREFVAVDGPYHKMLKEYRKHRWHRVFLGKDVALKMYRDLVESNPGKYLLTNRDHSERYQPSPECG